MIKVWRRCATACEKVAAEAFALADDIVWIELVSPSRDEERSVEAALGIEVPTKEDMEEIEVSSRLYKTKAATYMTALVLCRHEGGLEQARDEPVSFVLAGERLVTVRYADPKSFALFEAQIEREPQLCADGAAVFRGLIDAVIDRLADVLEETGGQVKATSKHIFGRAVKRRFEAILQRLGAHQKMNVLVHESLLSVARVVSYARLTPQMEGNAAAQEQLRSQARDVQSLLEHSGYVGSTIAFQLDAALGLIAIEQNEINKVFSIAALLFLPPTLIAGVYGMNFEILPELHWALGYPFALGLMLISVGLALWWIKRRGWL